MNRKTKTCDEKLLCPENHVWGPTFVPTKRTTLHLEDIVNDRQEEICELKKGARQTSVPRVVDLSGEQQESRERETGNIAVESNSKLLWTEWKCQILVRWASAEPISVHDQKSQRNYSAGMINGTISTAPGVPECVHQAPVYSQNVRSTVSCYELSDEETEVFDVETIRAHPLMWTIGLILLLKWW